MRRDDNFNFVAVSRGRLGPGASSGIGQAIALELNRIGFTTHAAARRIQQMEQLKSAGIRVRFLDLTDSLSIEECINSIRKEAGDVDVLVNNAG